MNIAVNTKFLIKDKLEGVGWFEYETLKRITRQHPEHHFYFIFDRPHHDSFIFADNITPLRTSIPSRHPILWYLRFHHLIPQMLNNRQIDLFYSPDGFNIPTRHKSLIALHDLNYLHFPENLPPFARRYFQQFFPNYARQAERIVTVSEYSKQDIVNSYHIDPTKIDVVYNGSSDEFRPLSDEEKNEIKLQYTDGKDYFIFVGALNPRKNLVRLLIAFDAFCRMHDSDMLLVISGDPMFRSSFFRLNYDTMQYKERVRFVGRLDRPQLARLVGGSLSLILPSTFEGFGIPIIEAMNCDVPVITSNITSMPEIAGDAALLTDPYSTDSICDSMLQISRDEALRKSLILKGRLQREKFSWDKTADSVWKSMEKCLEGNKK